MSDDKGLVCLDLLTRAGAIVSIVIPERHYEEALDSLDHAKARGDRWSPEVFGGQAKIGGLYVDSIFLSEVVAVL